MQTHNGWTNYPTWCVVSAIDNNHSLYNNVYNYTRNLKAAGYAEDQARGCLMQFIKNLVHNMAPKGECLIWSPIINDITKEVINYYEIANSIIEIIYKGES